MKGKRQDKQWLQALKVKEHKLTCVNLQTSQGLFIKSVMRMMSFLKSPHLFYSNSLSSVARFQLFLLIWL